MSPFSLAIRRPILITMVVVALVVVGLIGYARLGVNLIPRLDIPYVVVGVTYRGAGPREVETKVTKVIEDAVSTVSNVKQVRSYSSEGMSVTLVEFQIGTDSKEAAQDIRDRVSRSRGELPDDIDEPIVTKLNIEEMPIVEVAVTSDRPLRETRTLVDDVIRPRLERVGGVAAADVSGGLERELQVAVDEGRLRAYGLGLPQVVAAVAAENVNVPAGRVTEIGRRFTVRVPGEFGSVEQLRRLLLSTPAGPTHLSDLAQVLDTYKDRESIARLNGEEVVSLSIKKLPEANIVSTAKAVRKAVAEQNAELGRRAHLSVVSDLSEFAQESVSDVTNNLLLGGLLAVVVVFFFLRSLRSTAISALALPTSIVASFGLMYLAHFTLNMLSMMALALSIGMLIDDAIVVIENIHRHLEAGASPREAAEAGTGEIAAAVVAITLTIVAVFIPIAFMTGLIGQLFREFGLTVAFAVLVSLFVSLTLTPMLASRLLKPHRGLPAGEQQRGWLARLGRGYDRIDASYRPLLAWALRHRKAVVLIAVAILVASGGLFRVLSTEFMPRVDRGEITMTLQMPTGTSLEETDRTARAVDTALRARPEVDHVLFTAGQASGLSAIASGSSADKATFSVSLVPKDKRRKSSWQLMQEMREEFSRLPGAKVAVQESDIIAAATRAPVEIRLEGPDVDGLLALAKQASDRLADVPGLTDLDISLRPGQPEVQFDVDRVKATNLGLSVAQIAATLRTAVDGTVASKYREGGEEYDIRVRLAQADRARVAQLAGLRVASSQGILIPLQEVVRVREAQGPALITRTDKVRTVSVTGNLLSGHALGDVMREAQQRMATLPLPSGYRVNYAGEAEQMGEAFGSIFFSLGLAVLFVYMILAAQFESFLHPLTIGLSIPFALIGAILALVLAGSTVNIMSLVGIIMLMGLVTKNAILLVDYTNTLRGRGLGREGAILQAGPTRLRPILMTTAAMVFGMLPVALGLGQGAELRAPMAVAVIGGLLSSLFLTLLVVPVVYTLIDDLARRARRPAVPDAKSLTRGRRYEGTAQAAEEGTRGGAGDA